MIPFRMMHIKQLKEEEVTMSIKRKAIAVTLLMCITMGSALIMVFGDEEKSKGVSDEAVENALKIVSDTLGSLVNLPGKAQESDENTYWLEKEFYCKKKSSDPELVVKRITAELTANVIGWVNQILNNHTPTGKFETPVIYKKFGWSKFKFYGRVRVKARVQCVKLPAETN